MSTDKFIKDMKGGEVAERFLERLDQRQLVRMLCILFGYSPAGFAGALQFGGDFCGLRADDDHWCILPKDHAGTTHDAGDFTWDVWPDTDAELHTIAAQRSA